MLYGKQETTTHWVSAWMSLTVLTLRSCCLKYKMWAYFPQSWYARWIVPYQIRRWSVLAETPWEAGNACTMLPTPFLADLTSSMLPQSAAPSSHWHQNPNLLSFLKLQKQLCIAEPSIPTILFQVLPGPLWLPATKAVVHMEVYFDMI